MAQRIKLTLPDGKVLEFASGITAAGVAEAIGAGLARAALAAVVDGRAVDLSTELDHDASFEILTFDSRAGREVFWHSSAHVMAQAVKALYPGAKLAIGPPIEEGFYYDFDLPSPLTEDDLGRIEERMKQLIAADTTFERREYSAAEARELFTREHEPYKVEILAQVEHEGETISVYTQGGFIDLCRGPHLPSTGRIKAFKLLAVAGAYWKDAEGNPQLQRIYGVSYPDKKLLQEFLVRREEAARRDHRKLGKELDLFSLQEEGGGGLVFWHPKGALIRHQIENFWREEHLKNGYDLVYSPHIARLNLWNRSGHTDFYAESMYPPFDIEGNPYQLKPMNCPFHILIYKSRLHSYRELPLRWAELGTVYRYERSGVLHGLMRVRGFTQDDAHIFCAKEEIEREIARTLDFSLYLLRAFGFQQMKIYLSTRPAKSIGEEADWVKAESSLRAALTAAGVEYAIDEGAGAFYGPKIDICVRDAIGREWQCTTIQFDFNLAERFDLTYVGADGNRHRPFLVHRALLGSLERFFGILIEHYAGAFPVWLAPVQVVVLPIVDSLNEYAGRVQQQLAAAGLRSQLDERSEKINLKIREAELAKIPYMFVIGAREAEAGQVTVRRHGRKEQKVVDLAEAIADIVSTDRQKEQ
jgi:threonyl-tRNA synthetase